ncbi:hypothetical protein F7731_13855 [Cytobacillus depressus]|uniref:Uncharacterized protein n=1 Tax=Cytobacillus depressus TaxID=1602942 RepID=A0A6L3V605_9BACI|nr:hypothetical protein [Cytobacillus depressus]KAB2334839.1 hypothetical protein F7731_13855 [Cytobacillus depressus]
MVIQSNMSPKAVVEIWEATAAIFEKYNILLTEKSMEATVDSDTLANLLTELNNIVDSSAATCIEGG